MKFALLLILLFCLGSLTSSKGLTLFNGETEFENENHERLVRLYNPGPGNTTLYTFLATEDALPGELGKINCTNFFYRARKRSRRFFNFNTATGILSVRRVPKFRRRRDILKITATCGRKGSGIVHVIVNLIVFSKRTFYGDSFLIPLILRKVDSLVKENKKFDTGKGMASSLHRIMRIVEKEKNRKAFDEMMASAKVDSVLQEAINTIVKKFTEKEHVQHIVFRWRLNTLFSTQALQKLSEAAQCNRKATPRSGCPRNDQYRTIDGTCNNLKNPLFGSAPTVLNRLLPARYFDPDGFKDPIGFPGQNNVPDIPETFKVVKEFIAQQKKPQMPIRRFSHLVMQFGQFLDHDLGLTPENENSDRCMETRADGSFDPDQNFAVPCFTILPFPDFNAIHFARSPAECIINTTNHITVKQQINVNTAFVDGSQVYGSSKDTEERLRNSSNNALLKIKEGIGGDFLPKDDSNDLMGNMNLCQPVCFLAGDVRTNEQMVLASMHTLFVREHNRIARKLQEVNPRWNSETVYQETRKIVGAVLQKITYEDFLPIIIGNPLPDYKKYNDKVNPGILNSFSTAAFRFGHSLIRPTFDRLDEGFNPTGDPLPLRELFFNNTFINTFGIEQLLLGLLGNQSQKVDRQLADGLLNNLFERPKSPGLNLAALNIQRGRDHGLPGYNAFRVRCGLKNAKSFRDTSKEIVVYKNRELLSNLYNDDPNLADLWVAGLAEAPAPGGIVGATFGCIIREQMRRVRDGDRFFYEKPGVFSDEQLAEIKKASISRIFCDNLKNIVSVQKNSFEAGSLYNRVSCDRIPGIDLSKWKRPKSKDVNPCRRGCLKGIKGSLFCTRDCECMDCRRRCFGKRYLCHDRICVSDRKEYDDCGNKIRNVYYKNWKISYKNTA